VSLDSRLRLARKVGRGARVRHYEVGELCEALALLRACEKAERLADVETLAAGIAAAEPETDQ
jgi:hypothetical protein